MQNQRSLLTVFLFATLLASCSTSPTPIAERKPVKHERIYNLALTTPSQERTAKLTITRDQGVVASGAGVDVFLDGQRVARLATGESITIYATPERHLVGARFSWGPQGPAEKDCTLSTMPTSVRITTDQDANLDVKAESGLL